MEVPVSKQALSFYIIIFSAAMADSNNVEKVNKKKSTDSIRIERIKDSWIAIDKLQHLSYSFFISLGCQYVPVNKMDINEPDALPISSTASFGLGLLKELNDKKGKSGFFSYKDMVANFLGIFLSAMVVQYDL